jgi:phosphate uptake regulator
MLRRLFQAIKSQGVMAEVEEKTRRMFALARGQYSASVQALLEQKQPDFDLYAQDREINRMVVEIRKRLVEHFAVACQEAGTGLVLLKVINDIERVGDYAKNFMDLAKEIPGGLPQSRYCTRLKDLHPRVEGFFELAEKAVFDGSQEAARQVLDGALEVSRTCKQSLRELLKDQEIGAPEAIACALASRYLRRVAGHLKNVASTAVNPYSHIGYIQIKEAEFQNDH